MTFYLLNEYRLLQEFSLSNMFFVYNPVYYIYDNNIINKFKFISCELSPPFPR